MPIQNSIMTLEITPIVSESYLPDESPESDAKMPDNMLGYVALELDGEGRARRAGAVFPADRAGS
jgi:hypothetical protein